jgi:hypothetical protein
MPEDSCVLNLLNSYHLIKDCLCDLVVRIPGCRSRGPGFDSSRYQIFWEAVGLERDSLSHVRIIIIIIIIGGAVLSP